MVILQHKLLITMCGIAGFYDQTENQTNRNVVLRKMIESLKHRGEVDDSLFLDGPVGLAHVRLKIIDLSENGAQPMTRGNYTIVFNGEVYNYQEIKTTLAKKNYSFSSNTDTEVVLMAYMEWGEKCVDYFVGMWSFAIWDSEKQKLFCSRDRFGIKPFYYIYDSGRLYFASEYKSLKHCKLFSSEINVAQANRGLSLGLASFNSESYYEKITLLEPSCNLVIENSRLHISKYWSITKKDLQIQSEEERNFLFKNMFFESVRIHMRSDVTVGSCLSGGLDSSSIVSSINNQFNDVHIKAFHIYYEGASSAYVDEREFANEVLRKYPNTQAHFFTPNEKEIEPAFFDLMYYSDVPVHGSSYISQYFLTKLASQNGVVVLIDGQGADEYLAGYMHCFYPYFSDLLRKFKMKKAIQTFYAHISRQSFGVQKAGLVFLKTMLTLFKSDEIILTYDMKGVKNISKKNSDKDIFNFPFERFSDSHFDNFLHNLTFSTSLPTLLHYGDRTSMAFTIESRVPFLDHRLVEFAFNLNGIDRINKNAETKSILRKSMVDVLPEKIANRKDKKGFVTPGEKVWLRSTLKHFLDFNHENLFWLDEKKIKTMIDAYKKGDDSNAKLVWNIAALNQWIVKYN